MNRLLAITAAFAIALMGLFGAPASGAVIVYHTNMDGPTEGTASLGTGTATITYDSVAHTMRVQASFSGLSGTTTASHIHAFTPAPFSGTAGVATQTPSFTGFPLGVTAGTMDNTFDLTLNSSWNNPFISGNGGTPAGAEAALVNAMNTGRAYLNIHSTVNTGGEIRGFIPEPGAVALLGVGAIGVIGRRRRAC